MVLKVKECRACGQGFTDDDLLEGSGAPSSTCVNNLHQADDDPEDTQLSSC